MRFRYGAVNSQEITEGTLTKFCKMYRIVLCSLYRFCASKHFGSGQNKKASRQLSPLFCFQPSILTADQMEDLFTILSPEGSNNRTAEGTVVTFWRNYLQDAEGN